MSAGAGKQLGFGWSPGSGWAKWLEAHRLLAVALFYFLLAVFLGWELLWPGRSLYRWDTLIYNWPMAVETRSQWLSGRLPFWMSAVCCGTPLLENINAGVLYPLRLLCWLLPLRTGYQLFLFVHLWLSFIGMHLLVRRGFRLGRLAAFAGALAYGASGYARGMWDTHNFMALPWIPLGLAAVLEARRPGRWVWSVAGSGLCWTMMILGGDFQAACLWLPVALLLALLLPERAHLVGSVLCAAAVAALLAAPQWLPAWLNSFESYRAGGLAAAEAVERSFHPLRLLELLLPNAFGNRGAWFGSVLAGKGATKLFPWTASFHIGLIALLAAALALRQRRRPAVTWALIVSVVFVILSLGRFLPGFEWWLRLPVLGSFRYPEKYLLWSTLGLACLCAYGVRSLEGLCASVPLFRPRRRILLAWALAVFAGTLGAVGVARTIAQGAPGLNLWLASRALGSALVVGAVLVSNLGRRALRPELMLPILLLFDAILPWSTERPTSRRLDPLSVPAVASVIGSSSSPEGRFLRDRAAESVPLPADFAVLSGAEKNTVFLRESMAFNSPRLWGIRSAEGFSPAEAGAMRSLRWRWATPENDAPADADGFVWFCRLAAVEWVLTTPERARSFAEHGLDCETAATWGANGELVLIRVRNVNEVDLMAGAREYKPAPKVFNVWRARPGHIRVNLLPGARADLLIKESYAKGWRAEDEWGNRLPTMPLDEAFLGVRVPAGTSQVRLSYEPVGWAVACALGIVGFVVLVLLGIGALDAGGRRKLVTSRWSAVLCGCVLFVVVGVIARNHWGCVFDEGFHVARGVARLEMGDARLSYFHPPLQNLACAYFAGLAFDDRIHLPDTPGWHNADVQPYATDFAIVNRGIYPEMIRASRWGTVLFGLLLCAAGVLWAWRAAGMAAGWTAAMGLGLNPCLLAHGHLSTTDMGVAALAVAGVYAMWCYTRGASRWALFFATASFVLAAVTKLSGVIWLCAWAAVCVPLLAAARRDARVLWFSAVAVAGLAAALLWLYGWSPETIRAGPGSWWWGKSLPAGRYIEGLVAQGDHALTGQRAFFNGRFFTLARWWHMPVSVALKTPLPWLAAMLIAVPYFAARRRPLAAWVPWVPVVVFAVLLCTVNRLAIGVRHALPLIALGIVAASVWAARLANVCWRRAACVALALSSWFSAELAYPHYLGYFPVGAGGVTEGYRRLVDSNYDWGQDVEVLEKNWAAITHANGGQPPDLVYFGFVDPRVIYRLPVGPRSWCGFMQRTVELAKGEEEYQQWLRGLSVHDGTVVASISALALRPYGMDLSSVTRGQYVGRIGNSFFVYRASP